MILVGNAYGLNDALFEPALFGVSLGRRTSLLEIDIVPKILLDVRSARGRNDRASRR